MLCFGYSSFYLTHQLERMALLLSILLVATLIAWAVAWWLLQCQQQSVSIYAKERFLTIPL